MSTSSTQKNQQNISTSVNCSVVIAASLPPPFRFKRVRFPPRVRLVVAFISLPGGRNNVPELLCLDPFRPLNFAEFWMIVAFLSLFHIPHARIAIDCYVGFVLVCGLSRPYCCMGAKCLIVPSRVDLRLLWAVSAA